MFLSDRCRCYQPRARPPRAPLPLPPPRSRAAAPSESTVRLSPPRTIRTAAPAPHPAVTDRTRPLRQRCVTDARDSACAPPSAVPSESAILGGSGDTERRLRPHHTTSPRSPRGVAHRSSDA